MNELDKVSLSLDWLGRLVGNHPRAWTALGNLETALLAGEVENVAIREPVYICGLARAGSTILLEMLAAQNGVVTHRYQDFPFLFTPYWWNTLLRFLPRDNIKRERAHGDGILINSKSPEAMEEMLWMAFFPQLHKTAQTEILDAATQHTVFETFYRDHIRKLLLVRKGERYVSKGNYNVTRMGYLEKLFPDARFILPVRDPVSHIGSLMRQHERFLHVGKREARHLSLAGHFEFGANRTPIHTGDENRMQEIKDAWARGEEVRGWALYWDMVYRFVHEHLPANALVVRFEDLCAKPAEMLRHLFSHSNLTVEDATIEKLASGFRTPDYYRPPFSEADIALIRDITGKTAGQFGYPT